MTPQGCLDVNIGGLRNVIEAAVESTRRPWLIFASSREVYGQPGHLPVTEDAPLRPVNVYGHSKVEGERLIEAARDKGLQAAIVRLSNVYGSPNDHADRVLPAFARAAVRRSALRVEGETHAFDFTHLDDTVRGIVALTGLLAAGHAPPSIHLVTGRSHTLGEIAHMTVELAGTGAPVVPAAPRSFDVSRFCGDPGRARKLLGWVPRVGLREGLERLIRDFRREEGVPP